MSSSTADGERFPLTAAQLTGNFCETLFFGMYLVTFCFCIRTLFLTGSGRDERWISLREVRWLMTTVALILFVICTFDVALGLLHNFHAFVESPDPQKELKNISDWINIVRTFNNSLAMDIGDFILVYRCWIVYGRRWLVVVPSILLYFGSIASGIGLSQVGANPKTTSTITLNSPEVRPWFIAFFAITAAQNLLTTIILIWRIWRVEREAEKYLNFSGPSAGQPRYLRKVIRVIAESGAAYTLLVFIAAVAGVSRNNAMYPTSDMSLQATGITFNVILVRASAKRDRQFTEFDHNERAIALEQRAAAGSRTSSGSIQFSPGHFRPQDTELFRASTSIENGRHPGGTR